jgi:diguanylate cyclase (GGDEF)-like protein
MGAAVIAARLALLGLDGEDAKASSELLQQCVIRPGIDSIIGEFLGWLSGLDPFNRMVAEHSTAERIEATLRRYLLGLGVDFDTWSYFDDRLLVGRAHQRMGIPQSLYQSAIRRLQEVLIDAIPEEMKADHAVFQELVSFIIRISALDMSLAVESYCNARVSGLQDSLKTQRDESKRWRELSHTDSLTSLYNHTFSRHSLGQAMEQACVDGRPLCVMMADLDHFKTINDTYGHLAGDEVLRIVAARMLSVARSGDEVGRYGGEEFLFILKDTDLDAAHDVAERVRAHVSGDTIHSGGASLDVTVSIGLAQACPNETVNSLIERADAALYAAKAAGRNCVRVPDQI